MHLARDVGIALRNYPEHKHKFDSLWRELVIPNTRDELGPVVNRSLWLSELKHAAGL